MLGITLTDPIGQHGVTTITDCRGSTPSSNTCTNLQSTIIQGLSSHSTLFTPPLQYTGKHPIPTTETLLRSIPTMVLYDDRGLEIFDRITYDKDYYLTESEIDVLRNYADHIVSTLVKDGSVLIELGCGAMRKTKYILEAIERQGHKNVTYYAVDLSESSLRDSIAPLTQAFPTINFVGLLGCYEDSIVHITHSIPASTPKTYLWLGSSIGNLNRTEAATFLNHIREEGMNTGDTFLCGIDRRNSPEILSLAYNDRSGLTREFIMNGLDHCNTILDSPVFSRDKFDYVSIYNPIEGRHEAYYQSLHPQTLHLPSTTITLSANELIHVEYSYKYSSPEISKLVESARFYHVGKWTDSQHMYDLHLFQKPPFFFDKGIKERVPDSKEWTELWNAWDTIISTIPDYSLRPISLRHPYIFYLGHIPTFLDLQLSRALGTLPLASEFYQRIFERGMDPDMDDPSMCHSHSEVPDTWPEAAEIHTFTRQIRDVVLDVLSQPLDAKISRALWMCYEHEAMHLETLLYMLVQSPLTLPPKHILKPLSLSLPPPDVDPLTFIDVNEPTTVKTGLNDPESDNVVPDRFGWDIEHPPRSLPVAPHAISSRMISIAEYIVYLNSQQWPAALIPASWAPLPSSSSSKYGVKSPFGLLPLDTVGYFPVSVSGDQATRYAKIHGCRLPTDSEILHSPLSSSSYGFTSLLPVNNSLWEWSSTPLTAHPGYEPSKLYPGYSSDFFDGKHLVVLGGSWATVPRIKERKSFVNWYQGGYGYVFGGFRIVKDL
ncbi:histidine-specific methyltransferase [Phlyctochytrium arcticum]|nr:histidine-specific methyltransferase [Phlyctochytrium arcticum]